MITRARASALLFGGAALGSATLPAWPAPKPVPGLNKIDHIILIYCENRSFDHLYGMFPGADGLDNASAAAPQIDANGNPYAALPAFRNQAYDPSRPGLELPPLPNKPFDLAQYVPIDRPLNAAFETANDFYLGQLAINDGAMDRYVAITGSPAMGYYDGHALPMWRYAQQYVLADRFFQAGFGGTGMNHMLLFCANVPKWPNAPADLVAQLASDGTLIRDGVVTPDGFIVNNLDPIFAGAVPLQTMPHIGNRLDGAGVSWAWYDGDNSINRQPFRRFKDLTTGTPGAKEHIKPDSDFLADLNGTAFPQVAFVKPALCEHPKETSGLFAADRHIADLVGAIVDSTYWKSSVVIVTYDEGHSFWDHVAPPKVDRWGPGRRIPALVISPFAKRSFVDHTQYDTTSILKLIETRFGLEPLGTRDARAADLTAALNLG